MNMMCKKNDYVLSKNAVEKIKAIRDSNFQV